MITTITHFFKLLIVCFTLICCINIFFNKVVNTQNIYLYITFLYMFFIFLKIDIGRLYSLILLVFAICAFQNVVVTDLLIYAILIGLVFSKTFKKTVFVYIIHLCLLVFLYATLHQLYFFKNFSSDYILNNSIHIFKKNTYFAVDSTILTYNNVTDNKIILNIFKNSIDICGNAIITGDFFFTSGYFKSIFEKKLSSSLFFIDELYNYNNQSLDQVNFFLILTIFLIIIVTFLRLISKKNKHKEYFF